ncbi:MAG: hypothetical protein U0Z44_23210 [Kouleothrix sp.]
MNRPVCPFQIAFGPRTIGAAYPVRAAAGRSEVAADLLLPPALAALAARLLEPGAAVPLGDAAELGRALGRALFTPVLRDALLRAARIAAAAHSRLQLQLQIGPPELATLHGNA